jgi:hypothetical protein
VAQLTDAGAGLEAQVADLNAELDHKQPLFNRSISVNQALRALDEQLRSITMQRDTLTGELQELVGQLAEGQAGLAPEGGEAAEGSLAGLANN